MFTPGLVSISFRSLSCEEICQIAQKAGLAYIEWGSDVHAPCTDTERLSEIVRLQKQYAVKCCSYGTYFRLGVTDLSELAYYIKAAKLLGTDILRLWCGDKSPADYASEEKEILFAECRQAAAMAEKAQVTLCMECHNGTYTQTLAGAKELFHNVQSPAFRMYWQPNQFCTVEENMTYAREISPYTEHIHVFHWKGEMHLPLADGVATWKQYMQAFSGDHKLLLEFMPDNRPESLPTETAALRQIIGGCL